MTEDAQAFLLIFCGMLPIIIAGAAIAWSQHRRKGQPQNALDNAFLPPVVESPSPLAAPDKLAAALDLELAPRAFGIGAHTLSGEIDGVPVRLQFGASDAPALVHIYVDLTLPEGVQIGAEGFFSRPDPEIGQPRFDSVVRLAGDAAWLSAVLDAESRSTLLQTQAFGGYAFRAQDLQLWLQLQDGTDRIAAATRDAVRLVKRLSLPAADVPARLLELSAGADRPSVLAGVRLLAHFPDSAEAADFAATATGDAAPFAALVLNEPGAEERLHRPLIVADGQLRLAAVELLARRGTVASVQPLRDASTSLTKHATADAVRRIQERAGDANPGGLAVVAEGEGGELALTEGERGRLALSKNKQ